MSNNSGLPHPFCTTNILYLLDAPPRVKWENLVTSFKPVGRVLSVGATKTRGKHRTWAIRFDDVLHAEMALAFMQGSPVKGLSDAPFKISLSTSPAEEGPGYTHTGKKCLPQCVWGIKSSTLHAMSLDTLFPIFRAAGPVASLRFDVDVYDGPPVCVVRYRDAEHATLAAKVVAKALSDKISSAPGLTISLRSYDPQTLLIKKLSPLFRPQDKRMYFEKFGRIIESKLVAAGTANAAYFATYLDDEIAAQTKAALRGALIMGRAIEVVYAEPNMYATYSSDEDAADEPKQSRSNDQNSAEDVTGDAYETAGADSKQTVSDMERYQNARTVFDLAKATRRKTRAEIKVLEAEECDAVKLHSETLKEKEATVQALRKEKEELEAATYARIVAQAKEEYYIGVCQSVERNLRDANARLKEVQEVEILAKKASQMGRTRRETAEQAFERAKMDLETAHREALEEIATRARVAESIRRMEEIRREEEAHRRALARRKAEEARRQAEEAMRMQQEQEEREARERERLRAEREALEQERIREEAARRQRRGRAIECERKRCRERDDTVYPSRSWDANTASKRYKALSEEFDTLPFDEDSRPLIFENIPWPLLSHPATWSTADIDWKNVENFFAKVRKMLPRAEYVALIEQSHRRFHPDKWKARRILATANEETRCQLEAAGNIVTQALTPLWLESRKK